MRTEVREQLPPYEVEYRIEQGTRPLFDTPLAVLHLSGAPMVCHTVGYALVTGTPPDHLRPAD